MLALSLGDAETGAIATDKVTNSEGTTIGEHQWVHVLISLIENVGLVKALTILSKIAPLATAKPAEAEAMIPGPGPAQSIDDYMDLVMTTP